MQSQTSRGRRSLLRAVGVGSACAVAGLAANRVVHAAEPEVAGPEGTWIAAFQPFDAPPDRPPTIVRITLAGGGVVIAQVGPASRNPDGSLNYLSIGLGAWQPAGEDFTFNYVYTRYLENFARVLLATTWVSLALDPSGHAWSGTWGRHDLDNQGAVALEVRGTVQAARMTVEPLA